MQAMLQLFDRSARSMDLIFTCKKNLVSSFKAGVGFNEDASKLHLNGGDVGWVFFNLFYSRFVHCCTNNE